MATLIGSNGRHLPITSGPSKAKFYTRSRNVRQVVAKLETAFPGIAFAIEGDARDSVYRIRCQTEASASFYVASTARIPLP